MAVGQNQWYHFGVIRCTTRFGTYFSGEWDVHWGYDSDFAPWPYLIAGWVWQAGRQADRYIGR